MLRQCDTTGGLCHPRTGRSHIEEARVISDVAYDTHHYQLMRAWFWIWLNAGGLRLACFIFRWSRWWWPCKTSVVCEVCRLVLKSCQIRGHDRERMIPRRSRRIPQSLRVCSHRGTEGLLRISDVHPSSRWLHISFFICCLSLRFVIL